VSDYEIKASVLGFDPKHGELIAASAAKEVIAHFQAQLAKANERVKELEDSNKRMLHEVANQYDGNDSTEWSIGANHVFRLFSKWVHKNEQLRKEQGE